MVNYNVVYIAFDKGYTIIIIIITLFIIHLLEKYINFKSVIKNVCLLASHKCIHYIVSKHDCSLTYSSIMFDYLVVTGIYKNHTAVIEKA